MSWLRGFLIGLKLGAGEGWEGNTRAAHSTAGLGALAGVDLQEGVT